MTNQSMLVHKGINNESSRACKKKKKSKYAIHTASN